MNSHASTGSRPRRRRLLGLAAAVGVLMLVVSTVPAFAAAPTTAAGRKFTVKTLTGTRVQGAKSASGQLARTDKSLLGVKSSAPVNVVVKLDYDALAGYKGGVKGYAATSPSVTGKRFNPKDAAVRHYNGYVQGVESEFLSALGTRVPGATAGRRLRTVYGGVALKVAGNKVADLLRLPGVAAVQKDTARKPLTDSSPQFIGAPTLYRQLGGAPTRARA